MQTIEARYIKQNGLETWTSNEETFTFADCMTRDEIMLYIYTNAIQYDILDSYKGIEVHHEENDHDWGTMFGLIDKHGYSFEDEHGNWNEV